MNKENIQNNLNNQIDIYRKFSENLLALQQQQTKLTLDFLYILNNISNNFNVNNTINYNYIINTQ